MADPNTVRILSFDGGGMRGYLSMIWFQRFVQLWGINSADVWKNFDVITGTSVGGIIALALAYGMTPEAILPFFTTDGQWIFTVRTAADVASGSINASLPSNRPSTVQKILILGNNDQFYSSVDPASNYGNARLKTKLVATFGTNTLQNLKTNVLIPSYRPITQTAVLFSNLNYGEFSGQSELISNVSLATSAAPLYLPPQVFGSGTYVDGGIYQNNPAQLGFILGKMVKPTANRYCVLSVGTGLGKMGLAEEGDPGVPFPFESTVKSLVSTLDAAITESQESIARGLLLEAQYTLDNLFYYRFQPLLDPLVDTNLDNSDPSFLTYLNGVAMTGFNADIDNIGTFLGNLTA